MKNHKQAVAGGALMMAGLWGASYMTDVHFHDWMGFPSLMTGIGLGMFGLWMIMSGYDFP